jgi:predicted phosphodiesterase
VKIQLLSDLHLECQPHWRARAAPLADLTVLAGDIGSYQSGSLLEDPDFGLGQFSARCGWPTPAIFVPGNHEYDRLDFANAHQRLHESCNRLGIIWLEREVLTGPWTDRQGRGVRFLGTTLWSDFDALGNTETARQRAYRAANYYLTKTGTLLAGEPLLAPQIRQLALQCQSWLREQLAKPFDGSTVVITHFAPCLRSADPRYGMAAGTAGFCNQLHDLLEQAQLWLHGHLHAPSDYVERGCRVVANPLGYARKNEQSAFRPEYAIEL